MSRPSPEALPTGVWALDPVHSTIGFAVMHAGVSVVRGQFRTAEAGVEVPVRGPAALSAFVDVGSLDTGHEIRDRQLLGPLYFDAAAHPTMSFVSRDVCAEAQGRISIAGELTLRGSTHPLRLTGDFHGVELDPDGYTRMGLSLRGELSRGAYGMTTNQALNSGEVLIGDRVALTLDVSAIRRG